MVKKYIATMSIPVEKILKLLGEMASNKERSKTEWDSGWNAAITNIYDELFGVEIGVAIE